MAATFYVYDEPVDEEMLGRVVARAFNLYTKPAALPGRRRLVPRREREERLRMHLRRPIVEMALGGAKPGLR